MKKKGNVGYSARSILPVLAVIMGTLICSGCGSVRTADLNLLSTRNVNLDRVDLDSLPQTKYVVGEDSSFMLLFIPLGLPQLEDAVDDALDKGNGDLMIDVVVHDKSWSAILFSKLTISVKGTVVNTKN